MSAAGRLRFDRQGFALEADALGDGPPVLLLHGFPDTRATWAAQLPSLAAAGFRAVTPTMRGYAPGAIPPDGDYHAVRMAEDVVAIADQLGGRVHLVGHDWGASVAFAAVGLAPERFASMAVLAVPHPVRFAEAFAADPAQQARSAYVLEFQSPGADGTIVADGCAYLEALWRRWSPGWDVPAGELEAMKGAFREAGVATAALGWYRQAFDAASPAGQATHSLFAKPVAVPTLGLVGEDDGCISADVFAGAMRPADFAAGVAVERIADAGHFLHRERPEHVNRLLAGWLARNRG